MEISDLIASDSAAIEQVAAILVAGFREQAPDAWPNLDSAREEVREWFGEGHLSLVARDIDGTVLGWIGANAQYGGRVWELHPLVVAPAQQGRGIGRALVTALETRTRERGGLTLILGTDDETGQTSLAGIDLYPNVWEHVARIRNLRRHPYEFYQRLGFVIVGVVPDANGFGKPDILMAKSLRASPAGASAYRADARLLHEEER